MSDQTRICLACGISVPSSHPRETPWPDCASPDACTFDLTDREAWLFWRQKCQALREDNKRLRDTIYTLISTYEWCAFDEDRGWATLDDAMSEATEMLSKREGDG